MTTEPPAETPDPGTLPILDIARALHAYGTSTHRLEDAMRAITRHIGVEAQFLVTPTSIMAAFGPLREQRTYLVRADSGEINLDKLTRLNAVLTQILESRVDLAEASRMVDQITSEPPRYGTALRTLAMAVISAGTAVFLGGGWRELAVATFLGLFLGGLSALAERHPQLSLGLPALTASVAAAVSYAVAGYIQPLYAFIPTLAGLIVLLPGLTLTRAMNELASRHLVSGSARLTGALVTFLQLGFGVALGQGLGTAIGGEVASVTPLGMPPGIDWVALTLSGLALTVLFRAPPAEAPAVLLSAMLAFGSTRALSQAFGPELGVFLGACLIGALSNAVARLRDRPASLTILPGILMMVPGSLGFRGLDALLAHDVVTGVESGFRMVLIAVALVTGLFLASIVVPPRKLL